MIRDPLSYPGNKNRLLKEIMPEIMETPNFVDVFCGSGVVAVNSKSPKIFLNDINIWTTKIIETLYNVSFNELISQIEIIIDKYGLTYSRKHEKGYYKEFKHEGLSEYNKISYSLLKEDFNKTKNIYMLIVLQIYGFNHYLRFNKKNDFNIPVGKVDFSESIFIHLKEFVTALKNKDILFSNKDFCDKEIYSIENAIYYFDPPYLITNAPYNTLWNIKKEKKLLQLLDELNEAGEKFVLSNVILSNGKTNDFLIEWAKKYSMITLKRQYRNANYQKINLTDSIEVLIKNY